MTTLGGARPIVRVGDGTAHQEWRTQRRKIIPGHRSCHDDFRWPVGTKCDACVLKCGQVQQRPVPVAILQVLVVRHGSDGGPIGHADQSLRIWQRQRLEPHRVDHAEDADVRPEADGQRRDGDQRHDLVPTKRPEAVTHIPAKDVEVLGRSCSQKPSERARPQTHTVGVATLVAKGRVHVSSVLALEIERKQPQ
jgi:hypothetical protein